MRLILFLISQLFLSISLNGQFNGSNLLPVKIDGKWGLINANGNIVMEPKYDLIGEKFGSPQLQGSTFGSVHISVQLNNKVGLINNRGQEVLPPLFDDLVERFSDSIFTVIKDKKLLVVNQVGETIFDGEYEAVIPIPRQRNYFIVKKDGLYGLVEKGKGFVIPNQYTKLELNQRGKLFLNYWSKQSLKQEKHGLISFENEEILEPIFTEIKIISSHHFLTKDKFYELRNDNQEILVRSKDEWTTAKILSKSFISFTSSYQKKGKIYSIPSKKFIETKTEFDGFGRFGNKFLLGVKDGKYGLIDTLGQEVIPPSYKEIGALEGDSLFRVKKFLWGVYKIKEGLITPVKYDRIHSFKNNFAEVELHSKKGLINRKGKEVAPIQFQQFQYQDDFVKAFSGQSMNYYEKDSLDNLTLLEVYPEVYTLRVGYTENENLPNINPFGGGGRFSNFRSRPRRPRKKKPDYSLIDKSDVEWYKDWGLWGLRRKSNKEIIIKPKYEHVQKLPFTDMTIVYSYDKKIEENDLLKYMTINPKKGAFGIAFYSHQKEKFLTDFDFMGIRIEDFEYDLPYASCLDKKGSFILISQEGKVIQEKQSYDFIGDFYEGKARVCVGGAIKKFKKADEIGYKISSSSSLQRGFRIRYNRFITAPSTDLWMIGGQWGFIDSTGQLTISPQYEFVNDFEEKTAVCKKEKWGAIDKDNQPILEFKYRSISRNAGLLQAGVKNKRPIFFDAMGNAIVDWGYEKFKNFSEGFCAVKKNGKWGLVNEKGKEVLGCQFLMVNSFSEGLAGIQDEDGWHFIDTSLNIVLDFRDTDYLGFGNFSNGRCWFKIKRNKKFYYGYLDKSGEQVINSVFTRAFDFQLGRARVVNNRKTGLIDKRGNFIMKPKVYDLVFPFDEFGMAQVRENNMGPFGLINRNGVTLTPCVYNKIFPFINGYAKVVTHKGIGFVDTLGNEIIPPQYRAVGDFSEGLVSVQNGFSYLWEYININNDIAFKGKFSKAEPFKNGRAIVTRRKADESENYVINKKGEEVVIERNGMVLHFSEGKYGFRKFNRDPNGNIISSYCYFADSLGAPIFGEKRFLQIEPFEKNVGLVQFEKGRRWGTISQRGYQIIPNKYHRIFKLPNQMYSAIAAELVGLYDSKGKEILPPIYDSIERVKPNLLKVEQGSKIGYYTLDGIWLWQLQD